MFNRLFHPLFVKNSDVGGYDSLSIIDTDNQGAGIDFWFYQVSRGALAEDEDRIGAECRCNTFDLV